MHRLSAGAVISIAILGMFLGCAQEEPAEGLAKIGNKVITEKDLEARLEGMPPFMRQQISTPEGKKRFLQGVVEEDIIVREARARGLDKTEQFRTEMERRKRDLLVRLFYSEVIEAESTPSDEEVEAYYRDHQDSYTVPASVQARHILVETKQQAEKIRQELEAGADFGQLAREYSLDQQTKNREGVLPGNIQRGVPIRGLGEQPDLVEACFQLEEGQLSEPIRTELGYHIIRVDKKEPETVRPLQEVKEDIVSRLRNARLEEVRDRIMNDLRTKYKVVYLSESGVKPQTPEDLFKLASEESDPQQKITYYRQFLQTYPDNERAYEAKFMIGFTLAEDLHSYDEAQKVFEEFLEQYPESDLSDDARWMIENMRSGKEPEFD